MHILDHNSIRGYTLFPLTHGRGSHDGEPHMGTHTWPAMNSTVIAMVEDGKKAEAALASLRELDDRTRMQGVRAFVWDITGQM